MITEYEKEKAIRHVDDLASLLVNNNEGALYYKIFSNFINISYPIQDLKFDEVSMTNHTMVDNLSKILEFMVTIASEGTSQKYYTTGQLSKFFGVSITSINNWINEERFVGIQRSTRNKQIRIPEKTMWRSNNGELIPIKEVVDIWNREHSNRFSMSEKEEKIAVQNEIKLFENKYGGPYEKTLMMKEQITDLELLDKKEWEYLLKRINE